MTARRVRVWGAALGAAVALGACGGGDRAEEFEPVRIVSFGDESSAITAGGLKYGVNVTGSCASNSNWVQYLAATYGRSFINCPAGLSSTLANGLALAQPGAKVADLTAHINAYIAGNSPNEKDLVTLMLGANDVLEQYDAFVAGTLTEAAATTELVARGKALAGEANRIARLGPPVIVATVPDLSVSPFGLAQPQARREALARMMRAFNDALELNLINDGHDIGLVFADIASQNLARPDYMKNYGFSNISLPVCSNVPLPATFSTGTAAAEGDRTNLPSCTNSTLVGGLAASTPYLWAGNTQLGIYAHAQLGQLAESRAKNNPF